MNKKDEISEIILVGMSHKTAPVEIREKFCVEKDNLKEFTERARIAGVEEIVYLSTCNRVEVYFTARNVQKAVNEVVSLLEEQSGLGKDEFNAYLYKKYSRDVVYHLLNVASSLDSMVVGENEILTQIKQAYRDSVLLKNSGMLLNRLFHQSFNTAKKVKTKTGISQNPLSIAFIAVEQAKAYFANELSNRRALLIGAGEMGELILKYFTKNSIQDITIANRSLHNAERLVDSINKEAHIIPLGDIDAALDSVDIVITSVTSPSYILTADKIATVMQRRQGRPLFLIDIAVPRNIEPEVTKTGDVVLFNIDDLKKISDENLKNRLAEVEVAKHIVSQDATELFDWYEGLEIVPMIVKIGENFDSIRSKEFEVYKRRKLKHLSEDDLQIVDELTKQIISKILHNPIMAIKQNQMEKKEGYNTKEAIREKTKIIEELFKHIS